MVKSKKEPFGGSFLLQVCKRSCFFKEQVSFISEQVCVFGLLARWGKDLVKPCAVGWRVGGFTTSLQKRWGLDLSENVVYGACALSVWWVGLSCFWGNVLECG